MEGEENNDSREVSLTVKNVTYSGTLTRGENSKWSGKLNGSGGYHHLDIKEGTLGSDGTLNWGIVNIATITYTGQIRDGKLSGLGRLDRPGGYYESGTFVDGNISKGEVKTLKWDDGSVYEGAYSGGMFNGLGLKKGMNGDYEDGEFKNGSFSGNGKVRITDPSDGSVYEGEYSNKSHNGYGKITHKNGCSMEGEFVNGKERNVILEKKSPDGKSAFTHIIYDENGNPVLVQKLDKKPGSVGKKFDFENLGKIVNPLVVPTTSERKKNNRDGKSEEETVEIELSDSITYAGGYKDGKFEGWGTLKDRDGNIVRQGTFEKSIFKEGQAIVHNSDGSTYDGSIRDGKFEGRGTLMDQDGNIVRQGTFEKGIFKEGQAIVHNPDGTTYEGPIKDGKYWGEGGKLVFLNGDYRKGSFTDGSFSGTGEAKTTNFDGSTYEGYCSEWKSHGQGLWKDMAGNYRKGEFKENVLVEGKVGTVDGLNGCIRERDSRGGNLGDYFKITYKDGYSMEGEFFKDGKAQNVVIEKKSLDGRSTFTHFIYDENGNVLRRKELEEKPSRGTDERLNLVELEQFPKKLTPINTDRATKDEFERETVVIKFNGGNTYEGKYKNGEFDGNGVLKDEDGKIIKSGTFEKGIFKEGQAIVHNSDGTTYEGHVVGEIYSGLGKLVYPNGDYLEGNFSGGFFTEGKMRKANNIDGSVYEGEANRGVNGIIGYYGSGRLSYPNGDYQEGNFSGGFFTEGKIRKTNSDGSVYEGGGSQWQKYNGYGTLLSKDGSLLYRGEYVGGMQQGYGKHMYSHGCSAEGEFVNGRARNVILEKKSPDGGLAFIHIIYDDYGNVLLSKELEEKPGRTENGKLDFSGLDKLEDPPMEVQPITLDDVVEGADASGEVRIAYKDGSVYTGEVDGDCRPNGVGEWIGPGGELREGTFENGKFKSGTVVMKLSKNVTYAGKYENGKFNGKGTLKDGDGKVIKDGKFKEGEFMEGQATVHNPDGTTYEGPIKGGKYEGEGGKLVFPNGDHQAGEFQDDSFCSGTVRITNSDGSLYEGGCYNKKREGYGKLVYGDGCSVEGDFMNGEARSVILEKKSPDGKSTFIHAVYDRSGNMLLRQKLSEKPDCGKDKELKLQDLEKPKEPLMKVSSDILGAANELADGKTKIAYRDGSIYIGAVDGNGMPNGDGEWTGPGEESRKGIFKDGEFKSGTVKIAFSDSVTYEGGYSDGKFNGKGVLKDKEGKYLKDGIFKDGKFDVGEVIVEDSRGVSYQGHVEGGKYNGKGKVTSPNGDYREGDFTNGEFVKGQVKITSPGGFFYEGGYSNGKYQGYGKLRYVGGRFSVEGEFLDGKAKEVLVEKKSEISTKSTFLHLVYDDHGNMVVRQELDKKPDYVDGRLNFDASWAEKPEKPLMEVPSGIGKVTDKGNGKKEITYKDGTVYVGDADGNNMPDGNGKLTYLGGDVRDGAFKNGRFKSGNVVMKLSESIIYEGEYSNGRFDGKGSLKDTESKRSETKELDRERMPTERRYKYLEDGSFENGKFREGEVVVDNLDWTTYIGYIRDGVRDGSGELQRYGCELIDGKFSSDVLVDGNASLIFNSSVSISDSDMANRFLCPGGKAYLYSGEIRNGKYSGHGEWTNWLTEIYYDPAKNYRKGTFRDGKLIDGSEFIKDNNGERKGTVKDGLFNTGNAKITNADGSIYEGSYRDGKYNGSGKLVYKNGVSVEGEFEDGRARNVIQEITSADSKKTFAYIIFDEDGNVLLRQELEKEPERVDEKLDFSTLERPKEPRMVVPITLKDNRDSREEVEDGEIRIVYADDSVYVGEVNDRDRPNGKGKWIGPGGESREGIFKNGKFESGTVVMKFGDNITYAGGYKNGKFDGKGKVKDTGGKVIKDGTFKNGKFMKGKAIVYNPDGTTYEGYIKNGMYSNGKLIKLNGDYEAGDFVDGSFSGKGMVRISNSDDDSVYEGGYSNEKYHGYGKLIKKNGDIAEGEFSNGQEMKIFKTKKIGNIHYYQVFNEESRSYSYRMLDGELERDEQDEQKKFKMDDDSLAKLKPFWENDGGANTKYYFYGDGTEVKTIIEMDAAKANDLLSSGKATNLKGLLDGGALVVRNGENKDKLEDVTAGEVIDIFTASAKKMAALRAARDATGFEGGYGAECQAIMFSMVKDGDLKNFRFNTEEVSYDSMTSFLESIGIKKENIGSLKEKYVTIWAELNPKVAAHAVCFMVDLDMIRDVGWDSLNTSIKPFINVYDSSRITAEILKKKDELTYGAITKNSRAVNKVQQALGTCWFQAEASVLMALENPELVEKLLAGKIQTYGLGEDIWLKASDIPNELMLKQMQKLQEVISTLGVSTVQGRPLVESFIQDDIKNRISELAEKEKLVGDLDRRIKEAFEKFEKELEGELKDENAENAENVENVENVILKGEEYKAYKEKTRKEYGEELEKKIKEISAEVGNKTSGEKAGFIKNLKTFVAAGEKMNGQTDELASRLKFTLEKFREVRKKAKEDEKEIVESSDLVAILENFSNSEGTKKEAKESEKKAVKSSDLVAIPKNFSNSEGTKKEADGSPDKNEIEKSGPGGVLEIIAKTSEGMPSPTSPSAPSSSSVPFSSVLGALSGKTKTSTENVITSSKQNLPKVKEKVGQRI